MRLLLIAAGLAICSFGFKQEQDAKAKAILDEVGKKTKEYSSFAVEFSLQLQNSKSKLNETNTGKATMKGNKYIVEVGKQKLICDGKTVWTILTDEKQVTVEPVDEADDQLNPTKMLTIWEKGFKFRYIGEAKESAVMLQEIHLFPVNPAKTKFHTVILKIDKTKHQVYSVVIKYKNGDVHTLKITKFTPNVTIDDTEFRFDIKKYPGYTVID